jgi:hypothetical protein
MIAIPIRYKSGMKLIPRFLRPDPVPFALEWDEWGKFEADYKARRPIAYFVYRSLPLEVCVAKRRIRDAYWWVIHRVHPRHHYNIVRTGLPPGYYEIDTRMLYACFWLLKRFVEKERPGEFINWDSTPEHAAAWKEITSLYDWWTKERPHREEKDPYRDGDEDAIRASVEFETKCEEEDDRNLARLIAVRRYLWT